MSGSKQDDWLYTESGKPGGRPALEIVNHRWSISGIIRKIFQCLVILMVARAVPASAQWAYRAPVTVSNPSGSDLQNFQVRVSLGSAFNFAAAKSDGSDLRITASDGSTLLPFWIETWNPGGLTATIWVKLPTLPSAGTTLYIYYGNPAPPAPQAVTLDVPPIGPFTKAPGNPIVPIGDPGSGVNLLAEDIVHDTVTGHYWMVFSNYRDMSVGLAWSDTPSDPATWNWYASNPILNNANSPHLLEVAGTWYVFYGDWTTGKISYSTASDVRGPYSAPTVILSPSAPWESSRTLEPYVFQRDDGTWILMYMGDSGGTTEQVGYATASNIAGPYTKYAGNPVLAFGAPGTIDAGTIADPWVIRYQQPGTNPPQVTYYIGYAASSSKFSPWQTAYATTTDWVAFQKQGLLLPLSQTGWDSTNTFRGAMLRVGDTYVLSYTGDGYEMGVASQPAVAPVASIINNPLAVFDFFDGFNGTSLDTSKWIVANSGSGGTSTVAGGQLTLTAASGGSIRLWGNLAFSTGTIVEVRGQHLDVAQSPDAIFETGFDGVDFTSILRMQDYPTASQLSADATSNGSDSGFASMSLGADANFHVYQVYRATNGTAQFLVDGNPGTTLGPANVPAGNLQPWLMSYADSSVTQSRFVADWVRVRKSIGTDNLSTVGSQQALGSGGSLPTLASLTVSPSTIGGGSSSIGTVTLTGVAPAGGAHVNLFSANTAIATVPASVLVPAGSNHTTFTVNSSVTAAPETVTLSAFYNSTEQQVTLTVVPASMDTIPPVTTATVFPPPNHNGWNRTGVLIFLAAHDNSGGSGVKQIEYSFSGAQHSGIQTVPGGVAVTSVFTNGITTVIYFAIDRDGNPESPKTLMLRIDKVEPVISGMPSKGCTLSPPIKGSTQFATVTATDALSGIAPGSFKVTATSDLPWENAQPDIRIVPDGNNTFQLLLHADLKPVDNLRIFTLTASASDVAGNYVTDTVKCIINKTGK